MKQLNLKANTEPQTKIKEYLEQSASELLADKINFGVQVERDGKTLVNKKTLDGFMKYATEEARKQAEKGSMCACIEDSVVFGWAIHYFEEDSIIEKLYNEDGSEYQVKSTPKKKAEKKPEKKIEEKKPELKTVVATPFPATPKGRGKKLENQMSFFDVCEELKDQVSLFDVCEGLE
jgi:hypothetical protein